MILKVVNHRQPRGIGGPAPNSTHLIILMCMHRIGKQVEEVIHLTLIIWSSMTMEKATKSVRLKETDQLNQYSLQMVSRETV